jgi:hypothetical protein
VLVCQGCLVREYRFMTSSDLLRVPKRRTWWMSERISSRLAKIIGARPAPLMD